MQIHEITYGKNAQLDEGIADTLGGLAGKAVSGIKGAGQAIADPIKTATASYNTARQDQKVSALADKAYQAWKGYETQLLKTDPQARENGTLRKSLLAFVQKNLLGNMSLANVTNKDKIIGVVNQIGGGSAPTTTAEPTQQTKPHTGGKVAGQVSQTPGAIAKRNARARAKASAEKQPTSATTSAGAGAFGQMAKQLTPPNTMANTPVSKVNKASPTNPNQPQQPVVPAAKTAKKVPYGKAPGTATTPATVKGATNPGAPTPAEYEKLQQKIAAASKPPVSEAAPAVVPATKSVGSLASRAAQRNAPAQATQAKPSNPATPTQVTPQPVKSATPPNEKELFKQLVQYALVSATDVEKEQDAGSQQLPGGTQIKSTGNQNADALLTKLGYKVQA